MGSGNTLDRIRSITGDADPSEKHAQLLTRAAEGVLHLTPFRCPSSEPLKERHKYAAICFTCLSSDIRFGASVT
jgi:hypothetical protein